MTAGTGIGSSTGVLARSAARTLNQLRHRASAIARNPTVHTTATATGIQCIGSRTGPMTLESGKNGSAIRTSVVEKTGSAEDPERAIGRETSLPKLTSHANGTRNFNDALTHTQ